ncbi:MAG: hypothetical protein HYR64_09195 [Fimbriimonas ginsengisoli]|uniref:Uncharacterized protein n=1 Tax=Fimbriimonas ginsengisoli TaxID=1005039 RepID=A0A931LX32_FIMGI|nr:hypothetical protein [Fimbriimonas ginsengisoli]
MITCHLTKLELALDQVRKTHPKLKPADAALLASALTLTGRHAIALYDGEHYQWPEEYDNLTHKMTPEVAQVQEGIELTAPKKVAKNAPEDEPIMIKVGLMPNLTAGESLLGDRKDLKTKLSDVIQDGVEFVYAGTDIGWQWALDRANWSTIAGREISRRIKVKATFTEGAVGVETGTGAAKKRSRAKAHLVEAVVAEPVESEPAVEAIIEANAD